MEYWQKDIETMNREDLKKLQFERLRKTIEAAGNSPFYSKVFKENGITADSIQSLDDCLPMSGIAFKEAGKDFSHSKSKHTACVCFR